MNKKEFNKALRRVHLTIISVAMLAKAEIEATNSDYSKLVKKLDLETKAVWDSSFNKVRLECDGENVIYTFEEELCIYACLHIAAGYTYMDDFMGLINKLMDGEQRIPGSKEGKEKACKRYYETFNEVKSLMFAKLSGKKDFIEKKKELDREIPMITSFSIQLL